MTDLSARPDVPASSPPPRVAELLQLCAADYRAGARQRIADHRDDAHLAPYIPAPVTGPAVRQPLAFSPLDTAIRVGQEMLTAYGDSSRDGFSYPEAYGAQREALRILLHVLGAGTVSEHVAARRSVDAHFPIVAQFLADDAERGEVR